MGRNGELSIKRWKSLIEHTDFALQGSAIEGKSKPSHHNMKPFQYVLVTNSQMTESVDHAFLSMNSPEQTPTSQLLSILSITFSI